MEEETPRFDGRIMQRSLLSLFFLFFFFVDKKRGSGASYIDERS